MNMKRIKFLLAILFVLCGASAIYWVVQSPNTVVVHPKGSIAESELHLIKTNLFLMLVIIVPTFLLLLRTAWKYRASNTKKEHDPEASYGARSEILFWVIPSIIVAVMAPITWEATRKLDPFRPLESEKKPLHIQVVALDWKWLFIYPEQGIATVNFVQFPEQTPIRFALSADGSPMNSFWIPSLSGQIYCMTGMTTVLHMMAHGPGEYAGKAAEINGEGYAGMTFKAKSTTQSAFNEWVDSVKKSPLHLDSIGYDELSVRSTDHPVTLYGQVEKDLFETIVLKPMHNHSHS